MKSIIEKTIAALMLVCATSGAWAAVPVPTVVWDGDLAEGNTKQGSDGNSYTFTLNDANNTIQNGVLTIGAQADFGARVSIGDSNATAVSVLIRYTDGVAPSQSEVPVALFCDCGSSTASPDVGVVSSGSTSRELWPCFGIASDDGGYYYSGIDDGATKPQLPAGPGYLLFSYNLSKANYATGSTGASLSGGSKSGVDQGSTGKITYVGVGGHTGLSHKANGSSGSNKYPPWRGLKIDGVAIFVGNAYTAADLADYVWPSGENYAKYHYGNKVLTWQTPSDAAGNGGDYIAYNGVAYNDFDIASGRDSGRTLNNGNTTSSSVYWMTFCFGQAGYTAPGYVLRLAGDYYKEVHGKFSPMTIGGLIVESGATGYSFPNNGTNRSAGLGDPTGETETWFDIGENFTIARTGGVSFMGDVNLDIASGKTLELGSNASVMKVANVDTTTAPQLPYATELGGSLKLHGTGKLSINSGNGTLTATGSTMDYSDLAATSSSAEGAFVQGTLVVDVDTVFKFPAGATFPYFVAKSISGVINPSATMYIGGVAKEGGFLANANGSISYSAPVTPLSITTSGNQAWPAEWTDNAGNYVVNVGENVQTTFTLGATTPNSIVFNLEDGAVVTLSGTLTASQINVNGTGPLKTGAIICNASGNIVGTVIGDGTIIYDSIRPTTTGNDVVLTNPCWEGTVVVKGYNKAQTATGGDRQLFPQYWGSRNSKIKWNGVAGYFNHDIACPAVWVLEDLVENAKLYYALTKVDGYGSNNPISSPSLSGTGTFYDNSAPQAIFKFTSADNFSGRIFIDSSGGMNVQFGATAIARESGKITILSGASVTIPNGSTWVARNGFSIKSTGTLTVDNTQSMKVASIVGTLDIAEGRTVTLTGDNDALNYDGSGTVNVHGTLNMAGVRWTVGAQNEINLHEGGVISGTGPTNGNLDLHHNNGTKTIHAYGNATISATIRSARDQNCEIIVDEGKTLTCSGQIFGDFASSIAKKGAGTLKITNASSTLPTREAGYIELATGTWNFGSLRDLYGYKFTAGGNAVIKVAQTPYEYANGRLDICNIDSSIEHVTVVKVDSTETTLDVSAGAATMGDGTVVVGGKACTFDWEFDGDLSSSGLTANALSYATDMNANNSFDGEGHLYIRTHPYYDSNNNGLWTWADAWTVAIKCEVPTTSKGMVITFGNQGNGCVGLATSENDGKVILFKAGANGAAETISEMAVANRSGSQHLYLFSKTVDGKMQVYCDNTLIGNKTVDGLGSLKGTLQVGSLHGGVDYIGLNRPANDDPATIDFVQVYNYAISDAQRAAIISNYAWVNPNQYTRTVSGDENLSSAAAWTKPSDSSTVAIPVADADAIVTTSSSSAALTVNANFTAAALTVNSSGDDGAALRIKAGTGKFSAAKVEINAPVTVDIGAVDFASCPVAVADGQTLTFDVTGIINSNWANLTSIDRVKLTGVTTLGVGASIAVSPATAYYWSLSTVEDDGDYYLTFTPGRVSQEIYWKGDDNHTYWSAGSDNTADFYTEGTFENGTKYFPGDTVVIPNASRQRWFGPVSDGANIKFDYAGSISVKKTGTLGYALKNATVTVTAGTTIKFENDRDNAPEIYGGSISGAGTVQIDDGVRATFSNGAYMSCKLTGNGEVAYGSLPTSNPTYTSWTGTVVLPTPLDSINASGNNVIFFNRYGITGSTVKVGLINAGWLQSEEAINPTIEIESNFTLTAFSSQGRPYTFKAFKGSGEFSVSCPAASVADYASWGSDHSAYYLVKDVSNFTGSMTVSNCGIAIGDSKPDYRTPGGKIIVNSGKSATVAAGKTWTATNLKIDGEVSISNASAFSGTVEGNGRIVCTATLGSALTYGSWTGTVVLPYINGTDGGFYFNRYGKAGSTVEIANDFTGWLNTSSEDTRIAKANVVVNAGKTFTISGSNSSTAYGLTKLSGAGNFAFRQTNAPDSFTISTLEDFTGTISNSIGSGTPTAITITKVKLASAPTPGLRLVNTDTPNYVNVSGVYVGEVAQAVNLIKKSDGIYVAATSSVEGSGAAAVTTIATSSSDSQVEVSVDVGDSYTGTIIVPANVTKLATTGTTVADGKLKLKVNYGVDSTAIYENILTRDASGYISLTSDADAAVGGVKVTPEIKTGDAENPPMAMSGSAPAFSAKAIPGLWYAVKAASSVADLGDKFKYGTPVQATGDTVNIEAPTFPGTVTYYRLSAGMNQDDVTRYIVSTNRLAVRPTTDGLFAYGENSTTTTAAHDCYRIPAIASTWLPGDAGDPLQAIVMGIYDARTSYWDLGQRMNKTSNERQWNNNEHHFAGIDIAGNYSLDGGASWSAAQIMIDVPNAFDPDTGEDNIDSTSGINKAYDIGDPAIVYVPATKKFLMMGITGGGNSSVSNITANAMGADLAMYECTASSVANGAPNWQKVASFTKEGVITLLKAKDKTLTFTYPPNGYTFDYDSTKAWTRETVYFLSILQGPGNALVTREDCGSIKAGTIVFPMQYCAKKRKTDDNYVGISYTFALYSTDNGATWNVTSVCKDEAAYGSECCIAQLDDGSLLMEVRPPNASTKRAFFRSTDFNTWTKACELVESAGPAEGSILRIGAKDGKSVYACSFTTGATRADLQLFIGTDYTSDEDVANVAKGINWTTTPFCTIWKGDTGTASTGTGVDTVVYGYSSLVMLDETTLGVLLEAHGHIYFTKIDVSSALK